MLLGTLGGLAGLYLTGCERGGDSAPGRGGSVDILYDMTYAGPAGTVNEFFREVKERSGQGDLANEIGRLTEVPFESLLDTVGTQTQAQSGATLVTWYGDYFTFDQFQRGNISPLDDVVSAEEIDHWLLASSQFEGKHWGSPFFLELVVLAVNRRNLERAGVEVADRFESYDHFIEACERLKSEDITPIQMGTSDGFGAERWQMFEQQQVCDSPADILRSHIGEVSQSDEIFSRPREQILFLRDNFMNPGPHNDTDAQAVEKFKAGNAGMMLVLSGDVFAADTPSEFEIVGFPQSGARFNRPAIGTGPVFLVMGYGENQEGAGELLEFIHQPEQLELWWELTNSMPADDRIDEGILTPNARQLLAFIKERRGDPFALWWNSQFYAPSPGFRFNYGIVADMVAGAMDADEAARRAENLFTSFREDDPEAVEAIQSYIAELDRLVAAT